MALLHKLDGMVALVVPGDDVEALGQVVDLAALGCRELQEAVASLVVDADHEGEGRQIVASEVEALGLRVVG